MRKVRVTQVFEYGNENTMDADTFVRVLSDELERIREHVDGVDDIQLINQHGKLSLRYRREPTWEEANADSVDSRDPCDFMFDEWMTMQMNLEAFCEGFHLENNYTHPTIVECCQALKVRKDVIMDVAEDVETLMFTNVDSPEEEWYIEYSG